MSKNIEKEKKVKLRTAFEVISRLKWAPRTESIANFEDTLIGYDCRINGPMEKCAADFTPIQNGGDIPEHRIQYFRIKSVPSIEDSVFWDRNARVDKLFDSGNGRHAAISQKTLSNIKAAIANMKRIAEEKAIQAEEKAKRRARQQARQAISIKFLDSSFQNEVASPSGGQAKRLERHVWFKIQHCQSFHDRNTSWYKRDYKTKEKICNSCDVQSLKILTWNILFDMKRNDNNEFVEGDNSLLADTDSTHQRWENILNELHSEKAGVIALQEVTPRFLQQLQGKDWVQHEYELSSGMNDLRGLTPFGNLIMWRKDQFRICDLHICKDMNRCRAIVASLEYNDHMIYNVANVHLPSDYHNEITKETDDRMKARQREMSAIVAKLEHLKQNQSYHASTSIILGDFNTDTNLLPTHSFTDSWTLFESPHADNGFTYNWKVNKRAEKIRSSGFSKKDPRRIDRIYMSTESIRDDFLKFVEAKIFGDNVNYEFHPSDHFGVSVTFKVNQKHLNSALNSSSINTWTEIASPTKDSLLAIVLDDNDLNFLDEKSSLPLCHITLLNGFVDVSSKEREEMACQAIKQVVQEVSYFNERKECNLSLNFDSFTVFEHKNSATLVSSPNIEEESNVWLNQLYLGLRKSFVLCDEQESRFINGWTPHISLGTYANSYEARLNLSVSPVNDSWNASLKSIGIGLFQRDVGSGKFHLVTSIPLIEKKNDLRNLLNDAGASMSRYMHDKSLLVLKEVERACNYAKQNINEKSAKNSILTSIQVYPYGSHAIGVAIPNISDIDAVVVMKTIKAANTTFKVQKILENISVRLSYLHREAKIRLRTSNLRGIRLKILSVKLSNQYPSLDLIFCCIDSLGGALSNADEEALNVIKDTTLIKASFDLFQHLSPICNEMICGAIRIVKVWAYQRQIYGTKTGFLGGGGWIILILWFLSTSTQQELSILFNESSVSDAAKKIAVFFFKNLLSKWANEPIFSLNNILKESEVYKIGDNIERISNLNVIAPISHGNFGRSSTRATTSTVKREIQRAKLLLDCCEGLEDSIFAKYEHSGSLILVLEIKIPSQNLECSPKPADIKAWGASKLLSLIVDLEQIYPPEVIRPSSKIIKKKRSFLFSASFEQYYSNRMSQPLELFVNHNKSLVKEEGLKFNGNCKVILSCLTNKDFVFQVKTSDSPTG